MTAPHRMIIPNAEKIFPTPAMTPRRVASKVIPARSPNRIEPPISVKNAEILNRILITVIRARVIANATRVSINYSRMLIKNRLGYAKPGKD
jgi:hypothetical protein